MISKNQIKFVRSLEQKKQRLREGCFVAEGPKVVGDLLAAGFKARQLFAVEPAAVDGEVTTVTADELRRLSFLQHPQGVLGVFEMRGAWSVERGVWSVECGAGSVECGALSVERGAWSAERGLSLALDGVQDPGNVGTIIRVADWFGIDTIYCSTDTADAWAPKVVQATMGSIARVRLVYGDLTAVLTRAREAGLPVYGTLLDGENIYRQQLTPHGIIVMGNEGNGISPAVRECITHRLLIPSFRQGPTADSLNVAIATAITCSEFLR